MALIRPFQVHETSGCFTCSPVIRQRFAKAVALTALFGAVFFFFIIGAQQGWLGAGLQDSVKRMFGPIPLQLSVTLSVGLFVLFARIILFPIGRKLCLPNSVYDEDEFIKKFRESAESVGPDVLGSGKA